MHAIKKYIYIKKINCKEERELKEKEREGGRVINANSPQSQVPTGNCILYQTNQCPKHKKI